MTTPHHIIHLDDLYIISLDGLRITRIVRYRSGGQMREEVEYKSLTKEMKEKVLDLVEKQMK